MLCYVTTTKNSEVTLDMRFFFTDAETNYVRRNVVFSCKEKDPAKNWTQFEFSRPWGQHHDIMYNHFTLGPTFEKVEITYEIVGSSLVIFRYL